MKRAAILCLSFIVVVPALVFSQQESTAESVFSTETEGDSIFEKYLEESRKISEEFTPLYNRLKEEAFINVDNLKIVDWERWDQDYYFPLFKRSKQAMERITGSDDYLAMWEEGIVQKIITKTEEWELTTGKHEVRRVMFGEGKYETTRPTFIPYAGVPNSAAQLLSIYTFAVVYEHREALVKGTSFEVFIRDESPDKSWRSDRQADISRLKVELERPDKGLANARLIREIRRSTQRINYNLESEIFAIKGRFPPRAFGSANPDFSWHIMAIYSFKNERSENLLYQIAVNPDEKEYMRGLADWAIYYLALSPNSKRFLSCVEKSLHEEIKYFRGRYPELSETLFSPDDVILGPPILLRNLFSSLYDHYEMALYELYRSDDDSAQEVFPKFSEQYLSKQYFTLNLIRRLAALKKSLECNQTIPKNERERFEIVRRELAISHALSPFTGSHIIPYPTVFLKNGEDHFKTYFDEYNFGDCDNIVPAFE